MFRCQGLSRFLMQSIDLLMAYTCPNTYISYLNIYVIALLELSHYRANRQAAKHRQRHTDVETVLDRELILRKPLC